MEESKAKFSFKRLFSKGEENDKTQNKKLIKTISVVVLSILIIIIFASSFKVKKTSNESSFDNLSSSFKSLEYSAQLENKLKKVLSSVKDIGQVEVFVMVDSSPTLKYLTETNNQTNENGESKTTSCQTTVYEMRNGSIESPVVVVEVVPKIMGVLIVATGAKDIKMKTMLINMVSSVLSVNVSNIEVLEGKK